MSTRFLLAGIVAVFMVGCADVELQDVKDLEASVDAKISQTVTETDAKIAQAVAEMDQKITATDAKYASMLALEQQVKNGLEAITENAQLLEKSGDAMLGILQTYRNLLREQLKSVDDQITSLKPEEDAAVTPADE